MNWSISSTTQTRHTSWIWIWLDIWCVCGCPAPGCLEAIPSGGEYTIPIHFLHHFLQSGIGRNGGQWSFYREGRGDRNSKHFSVWLLGKMFSVQVQKLLTSVCAVTEKTSSRSPLSLSFSGNNFSLKSSLSSGVECCDAQKCWKYQVFGTVDRFGDYQDGFMF